MTYCGNTEAENRYQDSLVDLPTELTEDDKEVALELAQELIGYEKFLEYMGHSDELGIHDEIEGLIIESFKQRALDKIYGAA